MRMVRILGMLVVLVAAAAVVVALAPAVQGQITRDDARRPRMLTELDWMDGDVYIGAAVRDVDSADVAREKLPADAGGAVVDEVDSDGPAATAGLKTGDVVVEYDGEKIRSARHLTRLVRESREGRSVRIVVLRDGKRTDLTITPRAGRSRVLTIDGPALRDSLRGLRDLGQEFGEFGRDFGRSFAFEFGVRGRLGISVQDLTPQLADYFGAKAGVLVSAVSEDTPASKAGIKAGDVITRVDNRAVSSSRELIRELQDIDAGKEVSIEIVRDRKPMTVKATLEDRAGRRARTITRRRV